MGLTHYWKRPLQLDSAKFKTAVNDLTKILAEIAIPLSANYEGEGYPLLTAETIAFNGKQGSCETFKISQIESSRRNEQKVSSHCKTEGLPYDHCVRIALVILKHHLGDDFKVYSDTSDAEWAEARNACQKRLGYRIDFSLDKDTN